jgi:hypothetical protein
MTMGNSGHEETKPAADNVQPPTAGNVPNPSRRRFNRAGVGASAVVMTLASRSVLANMTCSTPSGFHSANMSQGRPGDPVINCSGLSYQGWIATKEWNPPREMTFNKAFDAVPRDDLFVGAPAMPAATTTTTTTSTSDNNGVGAPAITSSVLKLNEATLEQAMLGSQTPLIIKHLIAALLNASTNKSTNPSVQSVKAIFKDWNVNNTYEVSAGIRWPTNKIIEYLEYSQTPGEPTFPPKTT